MIVGRTIGYVLLLAAVAAFAYDAAAWYDTGAFAPQAAGELWFRVHHASLNLAQAVIQRYVDARLWDPVIVTVLLWPAFAVLGVPGLLLAWLFRRRRPPPKGMFRRG
ncbi:MAG: hypothetical protein AB7N54_04840 [Alphaproteobacteria bacterium]